MHHRHRLPALVVLASSLMFAATAPAQQPDFAIAGEGFVTAADVRAHNRLGLDLADIRTALAATPPDYAAALGRYAFGKHFDWRDSAHSLAYFADDYHQRMGRSMPGAAALFGDSSFQHRFMSAALMGTGFFEGAGQKRSTVDAARVAAINSGLVALVLNWCRLELSEASIRGPQNQNWSLQNGSPKNWNELFAFWWGPKGEHAIHAEASRMQARFNLPEHPTRLLTRPLADGQPTIIARTFPEAEARAVASVVDLMSILLLLDRAADLDAGLAAGGERALAARAAIQGAWLAASDAFGRADRTAAQALHGRIMSFREPISAAEIRGAAATVADRLGIARGRFGSAL
jgi:hypothetical protein